MPRSLQEISDEQVRYWADAEEAVQRKYSCSIGCAAAVLYFRTRSHYTRALELELVNLHKAGTPPDTAVFGK